MARGGRVSRSHKTCSTRVRFGKNGSDDSDEDYMVSEDEFNYSEDEYCSSLANDETEESLGEFEEEEEKGLVKRSSIKKAGKFNRGVRIPRNEKSSYVDSDDISGGEQRKRRKLSHKEKEDSDTIFSYVEEKEDGDTDESDEDSDEEFTPDEFDSADEDDDDDDDELTLRKKVCLRVQEAVCANGKKRKRNPKASNRKGNPKASKRRNIRKKPVKGRSSRKTRGKRRTTGKGRRKKLNADSDPDFVSSGSSDYQYTISEEEREQIREAGVFCRRLRNSFPTSSSLKINEEEEETVPPQRKQQERKGKEKVVDMKIEVGNQLQVCGVCLTEEGKRTVRGILNCCSHYFCFACIMEWSKVESRCPLCKRRFATIRKAARVDGRSDLKDAVIPIPERDQVYQPSEEELRGHLYPYDNVLCSECHQGGDDALMLLCDLCDSPAHTFCVGLGREVPEGSWYCDACRPNASLTSHNHVASNNLSVGDSSSTVRESFDLNELYVPETPSTQVTRHSNSPRYPSRGGDIFSNTGLGAYTLFERRRIQSRIQQFLEDVRRQQPEGNGGVGSTTSGINLFGSLISRDGAIAPRQDVPHVPDATPRSVIYGQGRLPDYTTRSLLRGQEGVYPNLTSLGRVSGGELSGIGSHQQVAHPRNSSIPNTEPDAKEQVQSMVKSHLKSLSRNMDLGYNNLKYIARTSTHTILAAFGLEHRWNEVYPVQTRPMMCNHPFVDTFASGPTNEYPVKGQCSSCFDWFVKNVVKEIMLTRAPPPLPSAD